MHNDVLELNSEQIGIISKAFSIFNPKFESLTRESHPTLKVSFINILDRYLCGELEIDPTAQWIKFLAALNGEVDYLLEVEESFDGLYHDFWHFDFDDETPRPELNKNQLRIVDRLDSLHDAIDELVALRKELTSLDFDDALKPIAKDVVIGAFTPKNTEELVEAVRTVAFRDR